MLSEVVVHVDEHMLHIRRGFPLFGNDGTAVEDILMYDTVYGLACAEALVIVPFTVLFYHIQNHLSTVFCKNPKGTAEAAP